MYNPTLNVANYYPQFFKAPAQLIVDQRVAQAERELNRADIKSVIRHANRK